MGKPLLVARGHGIVVEVLDLIGRCPLLEMARDLLRRGPNVAARVAA